MTRRAFPAARCFFGVLPWLAATLLLVPRVVSASPQPGPSIFLHAQPAAVSKNPCGALNITNCYDAVTRGDLAQPDIGPYYYVYLLAYVEPPINNLAGFQCGIFYQSNQAGGMLDGVGVDIYSWHLCAPLEFPTPSPNAWPQPGSGNLLAWPSSNCQTGPLVVGGYFYTGAYSADILAVMPRPVDGRATLADCTSQEHVLPTYQLGRVAFSAGATDEGCNGCLGGWPGCPPLPWPPPSTGPTALSLHLTRPPLTQPLCSALGAISCDTLTVSGMSSAAGEHYYAYLLASIGGLRGLAGVKFSIDYDGGTPGGATNHQGLDILSWARCGPASMLYDSDWPDPGTAMELSWDYFTTGCPDQGSTVVAGYFYVSAYSADILRLTSPAGLPAARLTDCVYEQAELAGNQLGQAAFSPDGSLFGCRPCTDQCDQPTPVIRSTWGSIKNLLGGE